MELQEGLGLGLVSDQKPNVSVSSRSRKLTSRLHPCLVVIAETEEGLIKRLSEWKNNVENRGMRVDMNKTKVIISGERQKPWCMWQRCW